MTVTIKEVKTRRQLSNFIHYPEKLYKGSQYWVPPLISDEYTTLNPKKNAAFDFCEARYWLAYDESGEIVGRVAGIINKKSNEIWKQKRVRFGWLDFINDESVLSALLAEVENWAKSFGLNEIVGPFGFTDMDKEGLLVKGFDKLCPFTTLYNYDYYEPLLLKLGYSKCAEWDQKYIPIPDKIERLDRMSDIVSERYGLRILQAKNTKELVRNHGMDLFHMYNDTFAPLYEFTPLTDKQIKAYISSYETILDVDFVCVAVDKDNKIVGFAICVPSLARAVQKAKGRLMPFGIFHILKALRKNDTIEALMIGIHPDYQGKGVFVPMFKYLHKGMQKRGIKALITNPQLEDNVRIQNMFNQYEHSNYMVRRCYSKPIA